MPSPPKAPATARRRAPRARTAPDGGLVTDPATTDAGPAGADHGQGGGDEQSPDSAGSGRDA